MSIKDVYSLLSQGSLLPSTHAESWRNSVLRIVQFSPE